MHFIGEKNPVIEIFVAHMYIAIIQGLEEVMSQLL